MELLLDSSVRSFLGRHGGAGVLFLVLLFEELIDDACRRSEREGESLTTTALPPSFFNAGGEEIEMKERRRRRKQASKVSDLYEFWNPLLVTTKSSFERSHQLSQKDNRRGSQQTSPTRERQTESDVESTSGPTDVQTSVDVKSFSSLLLSFE